MIKKLTPIVAIIVVGGLVAYAISQKMNGALLATSLSIIAGLGGYFAPHKK